ncbi:Protein PLASTID MOVEMENT IMPAIRED 2 [Rhynchospora pubera]|uniref:Protein PLASTID MOVEMENT IMPAIRED 2 n=1 Tax=Rhynchospora pubera TaxID=906938 RepID=A0AAV8G2P7_9POAL|nr:Protein PLASTID MOVEMENT IMPAIRED 2 [Rhynchospora pubera]
METIKSDNPEGIGSVKAAISLFGERINGKKLEKNKNQEGIEKIQEEEKHNQPTGQIEVANTKATQFQMAGNWSTRKPAKGISTDNHCQEDVILQLDKMKRELRKLQRDVKNVFESKKQSEKEAEESAFRARLAALKVEEIKRRLEEANEEHVIVELARIEAERETREIEAKRETEAERYKREIESIKEKINKIQKEAGRARELEERLAVTNSDVAVLQNEMQLVRAMETSNSKKRKDEEDKSAELKKTEAELLSTKKELESIKEEGFQYMEYMDRTRGEIMKIRGEVSLLKEREKKADSIVQNLNSKLLKAKSKLESAAASEERTGAIVTSLKSALDQMQTEVEDANKEKQLIIEETNRIRIESEKILSEKRLSEERTKQLVQELQTVKASERVAMKNLKSAIERTIVDRFYKVDQRKSFNTVTISKSEYNYLIHSANDAKLVADKKVEACRAWVEALQSGEKEIEMRTQLMYKEIERLKAMEVQKIHEIERDVELERGLYESINACVVPTKNPYLLAHRRSIKEGRASLTSKGVKVRRLSVSSGSRVNTRSSTSAIKRKKKMVPNLIKFIKDQRKQPGMGEPSE